jgi:hypothetical protein
VEDGVADGFATGKDHGEAVDADANAFSGVMHG